jgi:hypothetical protein
VSGCPSPESLQRLGSPTLSRTAFSSLEQHIQECPNCLAAVERMNHDGTLTVGDVGRLAELGRTPAVPGFEIEHLLGWGSMGVVYQAWQPELKRHVAVKFLNRRSSTDALERDRWLREAQSLSRGRNRDTVQIFQIGEADGWLYLVLELIPGGSLKDHLSKPLPPPISARLAQAIARAVEKIHEAGLLHLDLKPSNILIDGVVEGSYEKAKPLIGDFGIARLQEDPVAMHGGAPAVCGTPSYMAPEQITLERGAIGPAADIYAVGATLYHMLTGRPPFLASSVSETHAQVCHSDPVPPRALNTSVPRDLESICLMCLRKSPKSRYASAASLADDVDRFLRNEPVKARQLGPLGRAARWARRKPVVATLTALLLMAVSAGVAGIATQWRRAEAARQAAVASDQGTRQLLSELLESNPVTPLVGYRPVPPSLQPLLNAAAQARLLLQKTPGDTGLRIALTKIYGRLGTLYMQRRQVAETDDSFRQARELWTPPPAGPDSAVGRDWLATTYFWEAYACGGATPRLTRLLQSMFQAHAIREERFAEEPANLELAENACRCRNEILRIPGSETDREKCLPFLGETRRDLENRLHADPGNTVLHKRLALACLLTGDIVAVQNRPLGLSYWQQAREHYQAASAADGGDIWVKFMLAMSCSHCFQPPSGDAACREAIENLQQSIQGMALLAQNNPDKDWLQASLLDADCLLIVCQLKGGHAADAHRTLTDSVQPVIDRLVSRRVNPADGLALVELIQIASIHLQTAQPAAALLLAQRAAALNTKYAAGPLNDPGYVCQLGFSALGVSAGLNRLGASQLALEQAELARTAYEHMSRTTWDGIGYETELAGAWERIGKAKWGLNKRADALAAFKQAAVFRRHYFERDPTEQARSMLSHCYGLLVHYGTRGDDLPTAAEALAEREKLWPNDAAQLQDVANDFRSLALWLVTRARGNLSPEQEAQRKRYVAESDRVQQAAKTAASHAEKMSQADH